MTSCQSPTMSDNATSAAQHAVPKIDVKPNPAARERYALLLRFADLPGDLEEMRGTLDFEVSNLDCVPIDYERAFGGVKLTPRHNVAVDLRKGDNGQYIGTVHADALLDEDYYGLGVCHWALNSFTVHFRSRTTHFVGGIDGKALTAQTTSTEHYLASDFEKKPDAMDVVFGEDSASFYLASAGPQFTLTISTHKE
jgi:hypothetical protein